MECITTTTYSTLINGQVQGRIGLRQGNPLSLYLFVLCVEGLSSLIHAARNENVAEGIQITPNCPEVTHLFFGDDSFIFYRATLTEATIYEEFVNRYCAESGRSVNLKNSCMFFSNNTNPRLRHNISKLLGIKNNTKPEKYLEVGIEFQKTKV